MGGGGFLMDALSQIRYNRSLLKGKSYNERLKSLYRKPIKIKRKAFSKVKISKLEIKQITLKITFKDKNWERQKSIISLGLTSISLLLLLWLISKHQEIVLILKEFFLQY